MAIEIKTASIEPIRHTFSNVARRQGADKPASRYLEAMYDLQPTVNFHYRPLWDPDHELYDTGRTAIDMADWYAFRDPRQFYYGTWTITRSKQQDVAERNYAFVDKRNLLDLVGAGTRERAEAVFVPLRHAEYAANLNNMYICAYGYGTAITQAASFNAVDRLGIAQYLSRIGLMLDGNTCESLDRGKQAWLEAETWQPLRRLTEDLMVTRDWFELFVAQNFALDGLSFPLVYERIDGELQKDAGSTISMLNEFMNEWYGETSRWVDSVLKTAAAESDANKAQIEQWARHWCDRAGEALQPVATEVFGERADEVMAGLREELATRAKKKAGLDIE
ncbi:Phenol hydroxylase P1 protein [wastewater metagenome]|uniref:Phenol hydroxylase P1 protein n=3 Tax=root TaxID=1 RepID=A0A5B8RH60_9ZZZZ|nr:aromatic/alkene monooxygenase hydroxylase subunit beta [Arhodomonas aquaeolei]QEA07218.1 phenol hydroxylase P1 protein [uncultured organism]